MRVAQLGLDAPVSIVFSGEEVGEYNRALGRLYPTPKKQEKVMPKKLKEAEPLHKKIFSGKPEEPETVGILC